MTIFDILNDISFNKNNNYDDSVYNAYMINRYLSMSDDTIFYADEMNKSCLDKQLQYDFYRTIIPKKKRFFKYIGKNKDKDIEYISKYFNINKNHAKQYFKLLSNDELKKIRKRYKRENQ